MGASSTSQNRLRTIFIVLLVTPAAFLVISRVLWPIYSTGLLLSLLWFASLVFSVVAIVGSFVFLFFEVRKNIVLAFLPIILNVFLFYGLFSFDLAVFSRDQDFSKNLNAREEVVEMVISGKLRPVEGVHAELPDKYKHLSRWGNQGGLYVEIDQGVIENIYFTTNYSAFGGDAGFVYTPEKNPSEKDFHGIIDRDDERIKMKDHWTWIDH